MFRIEFQVLGVPKKVFWRYCRYAAWFRKPSNSGGWLSCFVIWTGVFVLSVVNHDEFWSMVFNWFITLIWILIAALAPLQLRPLLWGDRSKPWQYTLDERAVQAYTQAGILQRWEYRALAYAREARDAFYLVTNETTGQAMLLPKEALTPEQCAALVDVLTRGMPAKKFTRWRGAK